MITAADSILINRVRAYERQIAARERALAAAEKKTPGTDLVLNKRYVIELAYQADGNLQPQTKSFTVARDVDWFMCRQITFSATVIGDTAAGLSVAWTANARFRPQQISGTLSIRDSYRDRQLSDRPVPDCLFTNNSFGPRALPCAAKLPGGTNVSITYTPTGSSFELSDLLGGAVSGFNVVFSFIGAEVRGARK